MAGVNRGNLWLFIMMVVFMMYIVVFKTIAVRWPEAKSDFKYLKHRTAYKR